MPRAKVAEGPGYNCIQLSMRPVQTDNRNQRRVDVQPPTDSESHSMWWSRNGPSHSSRTPEKQFTEVERSGYRMERFYIRSTTLHPLTPPYEIGRQLARNLNRGNQVILSQRPSAFLR
jgi:hypothetical protein